MEIGLCPQCCDAESWESISQKMMGRRLPTSVSSQKLKPFALATTFFTIECQEACLTDESNCFNVS